MNEGTPRNGTNGRSTIVPPLGFGTYGLTDARGRAAIETALLVGYRHIDTAQMYGNEVDVGQALARSGLKRDEYFVTTKVWRTNLGREDFLRSTDESLERLGLDHVDLLLIHWPSRDVPLEESLDTLQQVRDEGKATRIGVSNFPPSLLQESLRIVPDLACIQVEYHPMLSQDALLEIVRAHGMFLTAYSPLGKGNLLGKWTLKRMARRYGKSTAQIVLRWHLQQESVVPIPKSGNPDHIRANFDIFDFELTPTDMDTITGLDAVKRFVNPGWVDWER